MSLKVNLRVKPERHSWRDDSCTTDLVACLPFYKSKQGALTHRVRRGTIYWRDGLYSHTSVGLWCGMNGFIGPKGTVLAVPPADAVLCAVCEAKAGKVLATDGTD